MGECLSGAKVAAELGVNPSQITRWQTDETKFVKKAAQLLAAIDFAVPEGMVVFHGEHSAEIAKLLSTMLNHLRTKENATSVDAEVAIGQFKAKK